MMDILCQKLIQRSLHVNQNNFVVRTLLPDFYVLKHILRILRQGLLVANGMSLERGAMLTSAHLTPKKSRQSSAEFL